MTAAPQAPETAKVPRQRDRPKRQGRAGGSALRQYRVMRKAWRRRVRRRFALFFGGYALLLVPVHLLAATGGPWLYLAGMLTGVGLALFIAMRDTPPANVAQWELGAWGEQWTAKQLRPLRRRGWVVLHDRLLDPGRPENVDHLVVGPAGVFVLDSKRWPGTVRIDHHDRITITSPDAPDLRPSNRDGIASTARRHGQLVNKRLASALGRRAPWVHAVVVIWGGFPQQVVDGDRVVYVAGEHLRTWLLEQPAKTQRTHPDVIAAALREGLPSA